MNEKNIIYKKGRKKQIFLLFLYDSLISNEVKDNW